MTAKLAIAKSAARFIVGASVSKVVKDIITNNTNVEDVADKAMVATGSVVIGMMAADAARDHIDTKIDTVVALFRKESATDTTA